MQVVSGPMGKERVHYEAPAAKRLDPEMGTFLDWFNGNTEGDWVVKAGLAHLWFVTIHPFEDGNGRIARAIADLALALQHVGTSEEAIEANRKAIRQQTEPLETFRRYLTTYAFEQAFCHLSDQLIVNLEKHWNARQRKL